MTHMTHVDLLTHLTHDPLTHGQLAQWVVDQWVASTDP